jgi:hypothetical protein
MNNLEILETDCARHKETLARLLLSPKEGINWALIPSYEKIILSLEEEISSIKESKAKRPPQDQTL